jgi:methionyl-tRNA synthetase
VTNLGDDFMSERFYITTAIDYPNGKPHMGHAYEKIVTDCYARWYRFLGSKTYFLTGTDENGQKLQESAQKANMDTMEFVDQNVKIFKKLCSDLNISNDDFIRTTEDRHANVAKKLWSKLEEKGDIYPGSYSGHYCIHCENFYTELQAPDLICPHHGTKLELKEEEGFFFKMSQYQEWILNHIKTHPEFIVPQSSRKEILSRLEKDEVKDVAFSRPNNGWGIPVPGHEEFVMYTWGDALTNYYTGLVSKDLDSTFWPADVHVIGKDIVWFHTVIWPCMLKALGIPLPKQVYVHGMILASDGKKMSKSLDNVIDPYSMLEKYPLDTFRYYLLRGIPAQADGAFSEEELVAKHNNELGNDFGNLIMRVIKLSLKNIDPKIPGEGVSQEIDLSKTFTSMKEFMEKREHNKAMDVLWEAVNHANQYVNDKEPWKLKKEPEKLRPVIYNCLYAIHSLATLMTAFMPDVSKKTLKYLNPSLQGWENIRFGEVDYELTTPEALFPKIEWEKESESS